MQSFSEDLQLAVMAAKRAGASLQKGFSSSFLTSVKSDQSLVTEYDQLAERIIREALASSPYSVLGEEEGMDNRSSSRVWVIDPIDGTTNFSRKLPLFAVSLGLMRGNESLLGVIYDPLRDECFYAEKGNGAFKNGQRLHIDGSSPQKVLFLNGGCADADKLLMAENFRRLALDFDVRLLGSTAVELCRVAEGAADAFISSGDHIWDFGAGMCIVQEAGGVFCDWHGRPWRADHSYVLTGRKETVDDLVKRINDLQPN
jgi:myo-inositol-1(or 4)-monophosphatase